MCSAYLPGELIVRWWVAPAVVVVCKRSFIRSEQNVLLKKNVWRRSYMRLFTIVYQRQSTPLLPPLTDKPQHSHPSALDALHSPYEISSIFLRWCWRGYSVVAGTFLT